MIKKMGKNIKNKMTMTWNEKILTIKVSKWKLESAVESEEQTSYKNNK